jgi:predicted MFS family arabinose efflux permease
VVWSVIAALHAVAPTYAVLFALRIALGLAESPSFPGATQTIHRALPEDERPRAFGVLFTGSSFGAMLIPPIATLLLGYFGWRGAFLGTAIIGLIWVPVWLKVAYSEKGRAALDRIPETEHGGPEKLSMLDVLSHPAVLRAIVLVLASAPALAFVFLWQSKYLVHEYGLKQIEIGAYLWLPPVFLDLGSVLFGDLASRRRKKRVAGASDRLLVGLAAVLAMSLIAMPYARGPWEAMLAAGGTMAGGGGLFALLTGDMLSRVPARVVSRAGGMTAAAQSLAYIIASPLIGWSVDKTGDYTYALTALGLWLVPGTLIWIVWDPKKK